MSCQFQLKIGLDCHQSTHTLDHYSVRGGGGGGVHVCVYNVFDYYKALLCHRFSAPSLSIHRHPSR